MKNYLKIFTLFTVIFLLPISYTFSQNYLNLPNIATIYTPSSTTLHPKYKIFLNENNKAEVYIGLNLKELNFIKLKNKKYEAKLKIKFIFYKSLEKRTILDSNSQIFTITQRFIGNSLISKFDLRIPTDSCFLIIITTDLYNKNKSLNILQVQDNNNSPQKFLILDSASNTPVFYSYVKPLKTYYIKTSFPTDSLLIQKFFPDTTYPYPPYATVKQNFTAVLDTEYFYKTSGYIKFDEPGIYKITSPNSDAFFTVSAFDIYFPNILTADLMIPPVRYISSPQEYNNLISKTNKKLAIDDFWLNRNNEISYAKKLIKIYYNRTYMANLYFTTTKEGWKTDRGMIFILLGSPQILNKGDNFELWTYYDPLTGNKAVFKFVKKSTNLYHDEYFLIRNSSYVDIWDNAVKVWNDGKIYSF